MAWGAARDGVCDHLRKAGLGRRRSTPGPCAYLNNKTRQVSSCLAVIPSSPATRQDMELGLGPSSIAKVTSFEPLEKISGRREQRPASLQAAMSRQYMEPAQMA